MSSVMPKSLPRCYILPSLSMATALPHSSTIAYLGLWYNRRAVASFCFSPPLTTSCQLLHTVPAPAAHDHFLKLHNFEYVQQLRVQRGPVLLLHFVVCVQQLLPERTDAEVGLVRDVIHARARLHPAAAGRPQATHNSKQAGLAAAVGVGERKNDELHDEPSGGARVHAQRGASACPQSCMRGGAGSSGRNLLIHHPLSHVSLPPASCISDAPANWIRALALAARSRRCNNYLRERSSHFAAANRMC